MTGSQPTVWIFGDQLNLEIASLAGRSPGDCRVLFVESRAKLESKPWHIQRAHVVVSAMAHFAAELEARGFDVDYRQAPTLAAGLRAHCEQFDVHHVVAMEPMSWDGRAMLRTARRRHRGQQPVPVPLRRLRRLGRRPQEPQDGGLLPLAADPARHLDG